MLTTPVVSAADVVPTRVRLVDARNGPDSAAAFVRSHLAGAVRADLATDLCATSADASHGGRHPLPPLTDWAARLGRWGIRPEVDVVVYDDLGGVNSAARCWWMLRAAGHGRVAILDGGLQAALAAGWPVESGPARVWPDGPYPVSGWGGPTKDIAGVEGALADRDQVVVDVRAAERYRGESEPIDPVAGHIPGAVSWPLTDTLAGGHFKSPAELRALFAERLGDACADQLTVHCGSGVTACHTLAALEYAGLPGAALYVGSWSEWCRTDRPRATGSTAQP